ncbi:MAG: hypothetical protein Unbinned8472contig1000_31 [Prokaryotic dsDNA virus sp.]|nr:MAG: hypothetical protein Unbinned8472contig1000_31 [Prokaryotic dsDNA virus sp.]|tara:strand:- start:2869 stop:3201 length:333 start_codon:yes stop_codon:yes gene_type:complete
MRPPEEVIKQRRRQLIVHSCLYYYFDESVIPDSQFDGWCEELVSLQEQNPGYTDKFDRYFEGFDGSTGMQLAGFELVSQFFTIINRIMLKHNPKWVQDKVIISRVNNKKR